jgi:glycosyltransferase involved in cell wall biosynthesis
LRKIPKQIRQVREEINTRVHAWREERHFKPIIKRERAELLKVRQQYEHLYANPEESPLVSVVIPTWNRGQLLVERTLPSVLNQSYQNLEIVVVGDHCTDDTEERINQLNDPRIRFHNLPERAKYPADQVARWRVAGSVPLNHALELAQGKWIAALDDDDVFMPDHIEVLLRHAQSHNLEFVYGKYRAERTPGVWLERGPFPFSYRKVHNSSAMYRSYLRLFRYDINAWRIGLGVDKHRIWRMYKAGVRAGFMDQVVAIASLRPEQTIRGYQAEDRLDNYAPQNTQR